MGFCTRHAGGSGNRRDQQLGQRIHGQRVPRPDRRHVHQLPIKQLDAIRLPRITMESLWEHFL